MSTCHRKQIRTSPSYCSVNLTGLRGLGGKVRELSARCARAMTLTMVLNLFFVTITLNNFPHAFCHCKYIVQDHRISISIIIIGPNLDPPYLWQHCIARIWGSWGLRKVIRVIPPTWNDRPRWCSNLVKNVTHFFRWNSRKKKWTIPTFPNKFLCSGQKRPR